MNEFHVIRKQTHPRAFVAVFGGVRSKVDPNAYEAVSAGLGQRVVDLFEREVAHQDEMDRRKLVLESLKMKAASVDRQRPRGPFSFLVALFR